VVLTYNRAEHTYRCLDSVLWYVDLPYELIIVDNASHDETGQLLARLDNATILRNAENVGFGEGCNQAAAIARGRYLLLLNNDAQLTAGCVRTLVETAERIPDCAAVGCKVVMPDGRLQEAGSIIWDDGTTMGYGRDDAPDSLPYSYVREVDYCSAACLLVRADVWKQAGGFDSRYAPAYYEDADLAMAMRTFGWRVIYQPVAVAVHQEYTSSSPDAARELMIRNRERFVEKWSRELAGQPSASDKNVLRARNRAPQPTVLFVDDRVESPDFGSGIRRTWTMLTMLADMGCRATFVPLLDATLREPWVTNLRQMGVEVVTGPIVFEEFAAGRAGLYQTVIISRPHNMHAAHAAVRRHFPKATLIYDAEALYFVREELREAAVTGRPAIACEEQRTFETGLLRAADYVFSVSEYERHIMLHLVPDLAGRTFVWGDCMTALPTPAPFDARADLLFVGSFPEADSPNEHAVRWFLDHVWPALVDQLGCTFRVIGRAPETLKHRASASVEFTGFVPDLGLEYDRHRVFIVPHQFSAGIAYKLDEAMSRGIPAVVSELTARQLSLVDGEMVLVGRTTEEFAAKIVELYRDRELWARLRHNALYHVAERCDPRKVKATLENVLARATSAREP
jgi:GT2 family glycosyltransferase/glycosyltransferase involved in cell wall biosynthesis